MREACIGADRSDRLILGNLPQKFWQHGGIANPAAGNFDGPDLQCPGVDVQVELAPLVALGKTMFARTTHHHPRP